MTFDGLMTHAMRRELSDLLVGGRVNKIAQPYANEVILTIRAQRTSWPLLLSANPQYARVQVTQIPYTNPAVPSNFTMTLRKYLSGAKLLAIEQVANDRVLHFDFSTRDELGDELDLRLVVEIMARHSNILLLNLTSGKIIDLIRHVGADQNRVRTLMPGATYTSAPPQDRLDPFTDQSGAYRDLLHGTDGIPLAKALQQTYQGFGRDSADELARRLAANEPDAAWRAFLAGFDTPQPTLTLGDKPNFTAFPYQSVPGTPTLAFPTLSELIDAFYAQKAERERVQNLGGQLIHQLKTIIKRDETKQEKLEATLAESDRADDYRIRGEILTTYLAEVPRGATEVTLPNFYDDLKPLTIALSNQLGPSQNAQKYFAQYQKRRNAVAYVNDQMAANSEELEYLRGVLAQIEIASPADLADIRLELEEGGYLKKKARGKKPAKNKVSAPERFYASDGTLIFVGKNNLQNDQLTLRKAKKTDIWLHAKDVPGSHVVIDAADPSEQTLLEAATLAAYFSKNRNGSNVWVDWLPIKKIRKPNGAKPGYVIYEGQKTLAVTPEEAVVNQLRQAPKN